MLGEGVIVVFENALDARIQLSNCQGDTRYVGHRAEVGLRIR